MLKKFYSKELFTILEYMRDVVHDECPHALCDEECFICAALYCEDSEANKIITSMTPPSNIAKMKDYFLTVLLTSDKDSPIEDFDYSFLEKYLPDCMQIFRKLWGKELTSDVVLLSILNKDKRLASKMSDYQITPTQVMNAIKAQRDLVDAPNAISGKRKKKKGTELQPFNFVDKVNITVDTGGDLPIINLSALAAKGEIPSVVGYDDYYEDIFSILSKKDRHNVVVCGKYGVGKTATVKNIANLINEKRCNPIFFNKVLVEVDFLKMIMGTQFKGVFEQKFCSVLNKAKKEGNYILFIDNLHLLTNGNTKYAETDMDTLLEKLFSDETIMTICTMTDRGYKTMQNKSPLAKFVQEVTIEEPSVEKALEIVKVKKDQYEKFHDVAFDEDALRACVELSKKHITKRVLPDSALDMIDSIGAKINLHHEENPEIKELKEELARYTNEVEELKTSSQTKEYDRIDDLIKKQIAIKNQIGVLSKEMILSKEPVKVTKNAVCAFISKRVDVPLEDLTKSEKTRLKGLNEKIKESVIGQDEAVDEVCRVVKRQRVGLGESDRPAVLMFLGSTGTGKTYLAKQLAKEVFGDDKHFVRMDMSEYADKTSVNKITGSNPGYVGYEDETYLLKALKQKRRFVLLLDEFEKSDEEVHNVFLQMFDEGRYTDNHGEEYSLKDVIIIMTSNVGASEAAQRGRAIGFSKGGYDFTREIIDKELKKKFKPEFLNRVQKIAYFNNLDETNLREIVKLEINKLNGKIEKQGYHLSEDIRETKMVDDIFSHIITKREYGARPIVNEVQRRIEDAIVDYMIENDTEEGHTFTYDELCNDVNSDAVTA